jgi:hypothetical protein
MKCKETKVCQKKYIQTSHTWDGGSTWRISCQNFQSTCNKKEKIQCFVLYGKTTNSLLFIIVMIFFIKVDITFLNNKTHVQIFGVKK